MSDILLFHSISLKGIKNFLLKKRTVTQTYYLKFIQIHFKKILRRFHKTEGLLYCIKTESIFQSDNEIFDKSFLAINQYQAKS